MYLRTILEHSPKENSLNQQSLCPSSSSELSNHSSSSHPLEGVDKKFLETYDVVKKGNSTDDSSQYYCDKVCTGVASKLKEKVSYLLQV